MVYFDPAYDSSTYRATGLDVVILKEEMGSRGKMGFLARLA